MATALVENQPPATVEVLEESTPDNPAKDLSCSAESKVLEKLETEVQTSDSLPNALGELSIQEEGDTIDDKFQKGGPTKSQKRRERKKKQDQRGSERREDNAKDSVQEDTLGSAAGPSTSDNKHKTKRGTSGGKHKAHNMPVAGTPRSGISSERPPRKSDHEVGQDVKGTCYTELLKQQSGYDQTVEDPALHAEVMQAIEAIKKGESPHQNVPKQGAHRGKGHHVHLDKHRQRYTEFHHKAPGSAGRGRHHGHEHRPHGEQRDGQHDKSKARHHRGGGGNRQTPKFNFEPYWSTENVQQGLKRGTLIQGPLRINPKNFEDSYIPHPDGLSDIYVSGMADRNRAFNSDVVAVFIKPIEEWKVLVDDLNANADDLMRNFEEGKLKSSEDSSTAMEAVSDVSADPDSASAKPSDSSAVKEEDVPKKTQGSDSAKKHTGGAQAGNRQKSTGRNRYISVADLFTANLNREVVSPDIKVLFEKCDKEAEDIRKKMQEAIPKNSLLRTGKIVYIIERKHSRACTGHLKLQPDRNKDWALFAPADHRLPRVHVPMTDCPRDFYERPQDHANTLFICRITEWKEGTGFALGTLARSLGEAGEIEPETEGILIEHDVDFSEFSEAAIDCLPTDLPWRIPQSEFSYRRDLRKECIFTIDPSTARDLDDALSCTALGDGLYEIGVHIADVSFFVNPGNALDKVAASRSTSVYLVQKVIPMLPRLLCEKLCSLNPDEDRLTFSVIWKMTEKGEIIDEWFGRSVIRSCVKLSYEHAQGFIEQPERAWVAEELPPISEGFTVNQIKERVLNFHKVAQNLRQGRHEQGALRLDQVKIQFTLDKETGMPNGYQVYSQRESNKLVEEFMLLANMAVAHKIYKSFPEHAVLRRHPPPQTRQVDDLVATCKGLGIELDASSSGSIQRSLSAMSGDTQEARAKMQILTVLCSKPMQNAEYFCTGVFDDEELFRHYALSVPLYTHFTSPIRRFPDVMVHRLLGAALGYTDPPTVDKKDTQYQCEHSNDKKTNSKRVQDLSSELYFASFVKECGPLEEKGMVMSVLDHSFDVLVLKLGVVKRVYCEKLALKEHIYRKDHKKPELTLLWAADENQPREVRQVISIFSQVNCRLLGEDEPLKWSATIKHPNEIPPVIDE